MKDPLDKLIVNCNKLTEGTARRIIRKNGRYDLSCRVWKWDIPLDLKNLSNADRWRYDIFIGLGRWSTGNSKQGNLFICIACRGKVIYLEEETVKVLINSLKEQKGDVKG